MVSSDSSGYGSEETRRRIIDVALEMAAEIGPSLRLADVASRAGVSRQAIYLHFGSRSGLLLALLPRMQERLGLEQLYQGVVEAPSGVEALPLMVGFFGALDRGLDEAGWVLEEAQYLDEAFGKDWRGRTAALRGLVRDLMIRLSAEKVLREVWDIEGATDLFSSLTSFGAWREFNRESAQVSARWEETITDLVKRALIEGVGADD